MTDESGKLKTWKETIENLNRNKSIDTINLNIEGEDIT